MLDLPCYEGGKRDALTLTNSLNAGMNANLNVNMDMGSIKEPQSRLRKWTTVDSISANTSLDQNASKNGKFKPGCAEQASGGGVVLCCVVLSVLKCMKKTSPYQGFITSAPPPPRPPGHPCPEAQL